jgi:hypothetical protein
MESSAAVVSVNRKSAAVGTSEDEYICSFASKSLDFGCKGTIKRAQNKTFSCKYDEKCVPLRTKLAN